MSLLKYYSKAPHGDVSEAAVSDHDASADLPSEAESEESLSSLVTGSGDTSESEFHTVVSRSSLPEVSDSEDDPSLPLPLPPDSHAKISGSVGRVDPAFVSSGTQASRL